MIEKSSISDIKKNVEECVGQKVLLRGNLGRNKTFEKEGTLISTSSNIFIVKEDKSKINSSYTYTDILTHSVELGINIGGNYDSILNNLV